MRHWKADTLKWQSRFLNVEHMPVQFYAIVFAKKNTCSFEVEDSRDLDLDAGSNNIFSAEDIILCVEFEYTL